ncbi:MAG: MerR family DNA-binding protein [Stenotrophobium sp.]
MSGLTIGKIAQRAGVAIDTVRYYERSGLLPAAPRRDSGYRDFPANTVKRLRFIRRAKELGFTLEEIGELLALSSRRDVKAVKATAQSRLASVEQKLAELQRIRKGLRTLIEHCPGHGDAQHCPILNALQDGEDS